MKKHVYYQVTLMLTIWPLMHGDWADERLASLTLRQKIGQLIVVAACSNPNLDEAFIDPQAYNFDPDYVRMLITDYGIAGVCLLGKTTSAYQRAFINDLQTLASGQLLIAQDAEWGLAMRIVDLMSYPRALTLAAVDDTDLVYQAAYQIGTQCAALGIHINFAPVLDINNDPLNPVINVRSFGDDQYRVARAGCAFARGLSDAGIIACAKHAPGHGDTKVDSHLALPTVNHTIDQVLHNDLYPFAHISAQGIGMIMLGHLHIPALDALPAPLSHTIIAMVRTACQFDGIIITDGLGMNAITAQYSSAQITVRALCAGCDMLLCPVDVVAAIEAIEQAVMEGTISLYNLDAKVLKVLHLRQKITPNASARITIPEYPQTIQTLFERALTLVDDPHHFLHDDKKLLSSATVITAGARATDVLAALATAHVLTAQQAVDDPSITTALVLVGCKSNRAADRYGLTTQEIDAINGTIQRVPTLVILFGSPYATALFDKKTSLLVAYELHPYAQQAVAQCLTGQLVPTGRLSVELLRA